MTNGGAVGEICYHTAFINPIGMLQQSTSTISQVLEMRANHDLSRLVSSEYKFY
jgi:hypothetical protein